MKKVLTIAGSDCSGGAGIQADLKTMTAHKVYGMSVITALTAQNTTGVYGVLDAGGAFVGKQLDCVFTDIFPDAVKIGMVSNIETIQVIAEKLKQYHAKNIVIDPVMVSTSGCALMSPDAMGTLMETLLPLGDIITPNIPEAQKLWGCSIESPEDMIRAAEYISKNLSGSVLIKGGHLTETSDDLLYHNGEITWFKGERIQTDNTHGTGCTLSSAIASNLALGYDMKTSVGNAKAYITGALKAGLDLGAGSGPLNHCFAISSNL
ncbi:MAG TPA: bifunctional hydroxymethylpyrimidine kinase/phosphomethylpyrimidine kinase [Candidatus Scybalocola faecigallinarum]|uniref:Hydroxymethylpyrimidine/phosphomethylpyrimidine kinase n=1 Tax=Candidatus Scybalocola faecigallinarum TaxID=2840941 RepID=A0A9D1JPV5_9FIRM|nr:bifunctional hydroxymethylpyrimidine kinase/phosphomethylpyrimidine kinase [Candidatus Scybalocola faecigallinarum]